MSDATRRPVRDSQAGARRLRRRHAAEKRFHIYGVAAVAVGLAFLAVFLATIVNQGYSAFAQTQIRLEIDFAAGRITGEDEITPESLRRGNYSALIREALTARFPQARGRREIRALTALVSNGARFELRDMVVAEPTLLGTSQAVWLPASGDVAAIVKGNVPRDVPESERRLDDRQLSWLDALDAAGDLRLAPNWDFFTHGDSRDPALAGIRGAIMGSFYTLLVTLVLAFPMGVGAAVYLEEFAPRTRWSEIIEVNINNLAAVPSIVFGLLGLAVFLNFFDLPRSAPLVGGMVLSLMTLPTIIIATRAALKAVPPSIREAALGVGASPVQVVLHHVVPLAMPGILTGTIIGMARALGETAPLLMIGMVAFIVDIPEGPTDPATVLPVQIFLWADSPERAFVEKTAAATLVLLAFLVAMNGLAVFLRKKFERRW